MKGKFLKPSGWKYLERGKSPFYIRDGAYGLNYMCMHCGKRTIGAYFGKDRYKMHYKDCEYMIKDAQADSK